jgi:signal peptidase II
MTAKMRLGLRTIVTHDVIRFATLVALAVLLLDWATKSWAMETLPHTASSEALPLFQVERNPAFAFSTGDRHFPAAFVLAARLAAVAIVVFLSRKVAVQKRRHAAGFALLLAGGIGNATDLIFRGGAVVDFISAGPFMVRWAGEIVPFAIVFNIADVAILFGILLTAPLIHSWALARQRSLAAWERRLVANALRWLQRRYVKGVAN